MNSKILVYNKGQDSIKEKMDMPKKININETESFGNRMAKLRNAAGYSQRDLARETGVSQRMIAYYEKQAKYPPTHLLPILAEALGTTADELLGMKKTNGSKKDMRLWRRFSKVEQMNTKEKRQVLQILDTFIEKDRLKKKVAAI
ncbi:MAG: helix-turn-helix domain-containing protein [Desulfobacterales bacterium]|nr:helix-turn-helix domain-containing protein [Desulfobacterales bacterium]